MEAKYRRHSMLPRHAAVRCWQRHPHKRATARHGKHASLKPRSFSMTRAAAAGTAATATTKKRTDAGRHSRCLSRKAWYFLALGMYDTRPTPPGLFCHGARCGRRGCHEFTLGLSYTADATLCNLAWRCFPSGGAESKVNWRRRDWAELFRVELTMTCGVIRNEGPLRMVLGRRHFWETDSSFCKCSFCGACQEKQRCKCGRLVEESPAWYGVASEGMRKKIKGAKKNASRGNRTPPSTLEGLNPNH